MKKKKYLLQNLKKFQFRKQKIYQEEDKVKKKEKKINHKECSREFKGEECSYFQRLSDKIS